MLLSDIHSSKILKGTQIERGQIFWEKKRNENVMKMKTHERKIMFKRDKITKEKHGK